MIRRTGLKGLMLTAASVLLWSGLASAQELKGGKLRVALLTDVVNFDPQQFSSNNFPLIKNLYDSLIEYTAEGQAVPSLATSWTIAKDNLSVTLSLRKDVTFHSGAPLNAEAVAATLKKAADPQKGKNVYATMSVVKDWTVVDPGTIRLNFSGPVPDKQITDLLQFISPIDPKGIDTVETKPAGTGAYMLAERVLGQRVRMTANPKYWRAKEPIMKELELTVFGDNEAANAALESGSVDIIYGGDSRSALRLRGAGYQLIQGPGPLVQVFRINTTQGPFKNEKYRQAFNHLMDRRAILQVGYAGLGEVTALPWVPASPAADKSYDARYAFDLDKARALLKDSGLSAADQSNWKLLVNGGDQASVAISQVVQSTLAKVGVNVQLDMKQGSEYVDALLGGKFAATFGGIGNIQKFPTRVATNSIYRTVKNPVLGDPHPHPAYVAAIDRVNKTFGSGSDVKAAYDNLNKVLVESAFAIPTNTYDIGLIVAAKNLGGITREIDNMLVARTIGLR
ncbi:MAG: ABC transporter substrate-binding protein [Rhodoferax sp.]|nr:ABC transporter substrate-binding protein [Rhodoferax sp.]